MLSNFSLSEVGEKYQRLTLREQVLVLVVIAAAAYFLMDIFVFSAQSRREQDLLAQQKQLQAQQLALITELSSVEKTAKDALALKEVEYQQLKKQASELVAFSQRVSPEAPRMRTFIGEVLAAQRSAVQAAAVKTLPVKTLAVTLKTPESASKGEGASARAPSVIYKHALDFELRGRYLDLMSYLQKLEQSNPNLFWANSNLAANDSLESTLRLSVFFLSNQAQP